jgi:hypothetical protein
MGIVHEIAAEISPLKRHRGRQRIIRVDQTAERTD